MERYGNGVPIMRAFWSKAILAAGAVAFCLLTSVYAQSTAHAPDGGTFEHIQSITIVPLINAPFSAVVTTEWTKILADGTKATVKNHRTVVRDSTGRIFQERRSFSPAGDKEPTPISALEYTDPNRHEFYSCRPAQKTCYVSTYMESAMTQMPPGMDGLKACNCASRKTADTTIQQEALGQKTLDDVEVTGSREITTIQAGQIGNQAPEPIVKEFWYSPRLGLNLVVKRFDPRSGIENFVVDQLSLNEPDPAMFEPPADYRVVGQVVVKQAVPKAAH
jgi:hypothetical protein